MDQRANHHSVHRIVLPSGRRIEVVRFHDDGTGVESRPLHICPECRLPAGATALLVGGRGRSLGAPAELSQLRVEHREDLCSQSEVEEPEDRLEDGLSDLLNDLHRLAQANMADEIDRFVTALAAGLILPEDF